MSKPCTFGKIDSLYSNTYLCKIRAVKEVNVLLAINNFMKNVDNNEITTVVKEKTFNETKIKQKRTTVKSSSYVMS